MDQLKKLCWTKDCTNEPDTNEVYCNECQKRESEYLISGRKLERARKAAERISAEAAKAAGDWAAVDKWLDKYKGEDMKQFKTL